MVRWYNFFSTTGVVKSKLIAQKQSFYSKKSETSILYTDDKWNYVTIPLVSSVLIILKLNGLVINNFWILW
jgi:hypothetical protein